MKKQKVMSVLASIMLVVALVWMTGCGGTSTAASGTTATGSIDETADINSATIWTSDKVHVVTRGIAVNAALTIQPGTIIKFKPGAGITVNSAGTINADAGSAAAPIIFTSINDDAHGGITVGSLGSPAAGDWDRINLVSNSSIFNYCEFYYGGSSSYKITLDLNMSNNTHVTNCTFAHNDGGTFGGGYGALWAGSAQAGTVITGNIFYDNNVPLVVNTLYSLDNTNIFHNPANPLQTNTYNGIFISFSGPGGTYIAVSGNITWSNTEVPYVINRNKITVADAASLTLADNVVLKFGVGYELDVYGTLNANATTKIVFTSIKDDKTGGDTNGDGLVTSAAAGDWSGVLIRDAGAATFNKCQFMFGGGNANKITMDLMSSNNVNVTNCTFAHNDGGTLGDGYGALWGGSAQAGTVITSNIFYDNNVPLVANTLYNLDNTNVFHNPANPLQKNTYNGIFIAFSGPGGTYIAVSGNITWSNTEVPYVVNRNTITVAAAASLTLADNVVLKFFNQGMSTYGAFNLGTGNIFTSLNDDTVLGDSNGDGTTTTPAVGNWTGIWFNNGAPAPTGTDTKWANWSNMYYEASH